VRDEIARIRERESLSAKDKQNLFQLAMTIDAPRLARRLVSETSKLMVISDAFSSFGTFRCVALRSVA
jgi:hypothetical protein